MTRVRLNADPRLRQLERLAVGGDLDAARRLEEELLRRRMPPVYPLVRDEVLREEGLAGNYYAHLLLDMIPPECRQEGTAIGSSGHRPPRTIHFLDREPIEERVRHERVTSARRPYVGLNLPNGYGDPHEYFHPDPVVYSMDCTRSQGLQCLGHMTTGIQLEVYCAVREIQPRFRPTLQTTGAVVLEARGSAFEGLSLGLRLSHRFNRGWTDRAFVRKAEKFYNRLLEVARQRGPVAEVLRRMRSFYSEFGRTFPNRSDRDNRRELNRLLSNFRHDLGFRGLPEIPYRWTDRMLEPEEIGLWNRVLNEAHSRLVDLAEEAAALEAELPSTDSRGMTQSQAQDRLDRHLSHLGQHRAVRMPPNYAVVLDEEVLGIGSTWHDAIMQAFERYR